MCNAHGTLKASDYVIPALTLSTTGLQFFQRLVEREEFFLLHEHVKIKLLRLPDVLLISRIFQYLENLIIPKECNFNMTLFENRVHALSNFFEVACIAGPWSSDATFDYQLSTYTILEIQKFIY